MKFFDVSHCAAFPIFPQFAAPQLDQNTTYDNAVGVFYKSNFARVAGNEVKKIVPPGGKRCKQEFEKNRLAVPKLEKIKKGRRLAPL